MLLQMDHRLGYTFINRPAINDEEVTLALHTLLGRKFILFTLQTSSTTNHPLTLNPHLSEILNKNRLSSLLILTPD